MKRRETLLLVLLPFCAFTLNACGSNSPTAPQPRPRTSPRSSTRSGAHSTGGTSYFDYKQSTGTLSGRRFVPGRSQRLIKPGSSASSAKCLASFTIGTWSCAIPAAGHWPLTLLSFRELGPIPSGQQYLARANWTQGQSDWGYGVLDGVPYIAISGWNAGEHSRRRFRRRIRALSQRAHADSRCAA